MDRRDSFSSLFFFFLSLYVCWESLKLGFGNFATPGPGFLAFILGILLAILSLAALLTALLKREKSVTTAKESIPWSPLLLTFGSLIGFTLLLKTLGFNLATFAFLFFLLKMVGGKSWSVSALTAICITLATYLLFERLLESQLPRGIFGF